eukprot:Hpha_TRINITY_DN28039_c0_g1::TRINITY_DN28039_c0_g1_i1::g.42604::m.42604/K02503/HINT1, hinT, hit; histidine triad (HIT) family protein
MQRSVGSMRRLGQQLGRLGSRGAGGAFVRRASTLTEEEKAQMASEGGPTIFDKILSGDIPSELVWDDEYAYAFRDVNPQAPVHVIIIPKHRDGLTSLGRAKERHKNVLGHLMWVASRVAKREHLDAGWRLVVNNGPQGAQSVYHLHLHVLGGRQMTWPPG